MQVENALNKHELFKINIMKKYYLKDFDCIFVQKKLKERQRMWLIIILQLIEVFLIFE